MKDDILESVSQRGDGAYDKENLRIQEVADELQRLCRLHEEKPREGKSHGSRFEIEQRVAEQYAKSNGIWIPMDNVFDLGIPGPSGNENDTYVAKDTIYKVNNLLNSGGICKLLYKILLHNLAEPATQIMIDTYMSAVGFEKESDTGRFSNREYVVWDVVPRNVLVDKDGDMYVIDAEIAKNKD